MTSAHRSSHAHRYHLTRASGNEKTGGIPVSTTSSSTCPKRCSLQSNGCYAESGPLVLHWRKVSEGSRGSNLPDFCTAIRGLPKHQLWRYAQAGDLPGNGHTIHKGDLDQLVWSNRGRHGFGYTHYDPRIPNNAIAIKEANQNGFTINLSAETLTEADEYVALGVGPVAVILPIGQTTNLKTPAGNHVIVCPASVSNATCAICAICAVADRKAIVGFPAHGSGKAKAQKVFFMAQASTQL